ncbi:MAG: glycosyltransferase family 4 protein [Methanobacterium formicicum]
MKIGVIAFPLNKNMENRPLSQFIDIIYPLADNIHIFTGINNLNIEKYNNNKLFLHEINQNLNYNIFSKVLSYLKIEIKIISDLIKLSKEVDVVLFYGVDLPLVVLITKLLNKRSAMILASSPIESIKIPKTKIISYLKLFMSKIALFFSDKIILYSKKYIKEWNLEKYEWKIIVARKHFIDFNNFKLKKPINERDNLIGYMGRLEEGKGIIQFMKSIPRIIEQSDDVCFVIGGEGTLLNYVEKFISQNCLDNKVKLLGWVQYDEIPNYLNELKLLIIPSFSETGPMVALEAMACGTPILTTKVGFIPEMIINGKSGFLLKDNHPDEISQYVINILKNKDLNEITKNAMIISSEFDYDEVLKNYKSILCSLT